MSKIYYIYHIPNFIWKDGSIGKIGCTKNPNLRIKKRQGYTEWSIIESHNDIYIASNREIELQKEYGYKVDKIPYWKTIKVTNLGGKVGGIVNLINNTGLFGMSEEQKKNARVKGGISVGNKNAKNGQVIKAGIISSKSPNHPNNVKIKCEYCGKETNIGLYSRWHGKNCKNKTNE